MGCKSYALHLMSYCQKHEDEHIAERNKKRNDNDNRPPSSERGYDWLWNKLRDRYIKNNPLCAHCLKEQRITDAQMVDHIIPIAVRQDLRLSEDNLQSLCLSCHTIKTQQDIKNYPATYDKNESVWNNLFK
jgi:5-methylcytosine-specific restriction enzyme A